MRNVIFKRVGIYGVPVYGGWIQAGDPLHPEQPDCVYIDSTTFDTRRSTQRACTSSYDCPNSRYHVCDHDTGECVPSQCDQGTRFDGVKGQQVPTDTPACSPERVCNLQLDTDDWYYGAHVEHAFTTGECVVPCENENDTSCGVGKICQPTEMVVGKKATAVCVSAK
jgi:hypothetical protein